ncbi:phosphotransferase enzyme family protein [Actinomycetes bacterium M1A6_2h]
MPDFARLALPAWGIPSSASVELVSTSENATYSVTDSGTRRALRVHRAGYHSLRAIESEHAWIDALRRDNVVRSPAVVRTSSGESVARVNDRHVALFEWVDGRSPDDTPQSFREIGAVSARLHAHARSWRLPARFSRLTWGFDEQLGPHAHWGKWQDAVDLDAAGSDVLRRCVRIIESRVRQFGCGGDRFGLIHSDLRAANLVVDDSGAVTVIDFDDCGFGWYIADLAASLSFIEDRSDVLELVDAWLTGYRSVGALSADEESMVSTFVAMRRIQLTAWIASHPDADTAKQLGPTFTGGTLAIAESYLSATPTLARSSGPRP